MSSAMPSQTRVDASNRDAWLESRRTYIGASESFQVCKGNRLKVYLQKAGLLDPDPPALAMRIGLALEPLIAERYQEEGLGKIVSTQVFMRHMETPWIGATIDGTLEDGNIVEFKYASDHRRGDFGPDGSDEVPEPWIFQAQQQMYVDDAERCDFAVFLGTEFRWFRVARHQAMIDVMLRVEERFWKDHVEPRVAPGLGGDEPTGHVLALYPEPASWTFLDPQVASTVAAFERAKQLKRESEKEAESLRSRLFQALGEYREGHLPDGTVVRRVDSIRHQKPSPAKQSKATKLDIIRPRNS